MTFALRNSGAGCFALIFMGEHIGAVFQANDEAAAPWIAIIRDDWANRATELPRPFQGRSHEFATLRQLWNWLGGSEIALKHLPHSQAAR